MLRKVLVSTDFSECCTGKVMSFLREMSESIKEGVIVMYVINEKEIRTMSMGIAWIGETQERFEKELRRKFKERAEREIQKVKKELENEGFNVETIIVEGFPAEEIVKISDRDDVSLIAMGSHGKSNLESVLLGSVSEEVVKKAKKPVLVVRG